MALKPLLKIILAVTSWVTTNPPTHPAAESGKQPAAFIMPSPPPEPATPYGNAPRLLVKWGSYGEGPGQFIYIPDIAVDEMDNLYAADANRGLVRKYSSAGRFILEWSVRLPGQFHSLVNLAVGAGRVFISDGSNSILVFTDRGRYVTQWGQRGSGPGQLHAPQGVAVDRNGYVYVVDRFNYRVEKFTVDGKFVTQWGRQGSGAGEFLQPVGVAVDRAGNVYVADYEIGGVQKFTSNGKFVSRWRTRAQNPTDYTYAFKVAVDSLGNVYMADNHRNQVEEYTSQGTLIRAWSSGGPGVSHFVYPSSLAVDSHGDVFVVAGSEGEMVASVFIRKFGFGPTVAEQLLTRVFRSPDRVNALLDTLIATPIGESWAAWRGPSPRGECEITDETPSQRSDGWVTRCRDAAPIDSLETRGYVLGFETEPTLEAVSWEFGAGGASTDPRALYEAFSDLLARRLGFPAGAVSGAATVGEETRVFPVPGDSLRLSIHYQKSGEHPAVIRMERSSDGLLASQSAPPDTSDLRLFDGRRYERGTIRRDLIRALVHRPSVAAALRSPPPASLDHLHDVEHALEDVSNPRTAADDRDLVYLSADEWVASLARAQDSSSVSRLHHSLGRFGVQFQWEPDDQRFDYCGSLLPAVALNAGSNPWADRAFVLLLDQGMDTSCNDQYEGADFGNEMFPPVLKYGEAFLLQHPSSPTWPAVALRVALAHETVWSLSFATTDADFPDYRQGAGKHRERALELYRGLVPRVRDPLFRRALETKIRLLESGLDTHCRAYYLEFGD